MRVLRRSRKMTQAELARKAGFTQQHIAKIEKGIVRPRPQTMAKINRCLGPLQHEYKPEGISFRADRVTESVTAWFTSDPGLKTQSR